MNFYIYSIRVSLLLFAVVTISFSQSQWRQVIPDTQKWQDVIVKSNSVDTLWCAQVSDGKVYRSTDTGNTWNEITIPFNLKDINDMFVPSGKDCYIITEKYSHFIYFTHDAGTTWDTIYHRKTQFAKPYKANLFFTSPDTGWYYNRDIQTQTKSYRVRTVDGGRTWEEKLIPIFPRDLNYLGGSNYIASDEYGKDIYKSDNNGSTWKKVGSIPDISQPAPYWAMIRQMHLFSETHWYIASEVADTSGYMYRYICGKVHKTSDAGKTWDVDTVALNSYDGASAECIRFVASNHGYVCTKDTLWEFTEQGTWVAAVDTGNKVLKNGYGPLWHCSNRVFAGTKKGGLLCTVTGNNIAIKYSPYRTKGKKGFQPGIVLRKEYFNMRGQKIDLLENRFRHYKMLNSILLQRTVYSNGQVTQKMVHLR